MHAAGVAGARAARGVVVVIDVVRAFSVSAYALAAGAPECWLVGDLDEARSLAAGLKGALLSAEVDGLPVDGIPLSNSPTLLLRAGVAGRPLVQRTTSGVQGMVAATGADRLFAGSLVVASATARALRAQGPELVTLVATGEDRGHPEDRACAVYLEGLLAGRRPDLGALLTPLYATERYRQVAEGRWPGFPPGDLDLCLAADRFDFAMPVEQAEPGLRVTMLPAPA